MILVTQFREEVKYCRDETKHQCFAKRLKEGCGDSATELRQSKGGPACTNQKGKAIGNVFLITTSDSDKCAIVGVEKVKIQEGADVVKDWVQADLKIPLSGLEEDQGSDADKWVNATSCQAFGSTPPSWGMKFASIIFSLFHIVAQFTAIFWQVSKQNQCDCPFACCSCVVGIILVVHTFWIFTLSGGALFQVVYWYEAGTTGLSLLLLAYSKLRDKPDMWEASDFLSQVYEILVTLVLGLGSDIWGLIANRDRRICDIQGLQIAMIVVNVVSFIGRMCLFYLRDWCCLRDSSGISGTSVVESSLGFTRYFKGGQPIARF